jgi:glyoxylase-like metal-dependent hydrolase (beta-lactamase superfamily II)/rhodanese-related sulfurtransferase
MNSQTVPEITPLEFIRALEGGEAFQVVDVRLPEKAAGRSIDLVPPERFHTIAGSSLIGLPDLAGTGIDPALPAVVVCGHGNDSKLSTAFLNRMGVSARSLSGGMASWMKLSIARPLRPPDGLDGLVQFDRIGKGALGYLLTSSGEAMIIDPPRDPGPYLDLMEKSGGSLVAVADTHVHADYISGAPSLARERGVPYYLHPADNVYPYDDSPGRLNIRPLHDGMSIHLGRCVVGVVHTPGHSPGSVTYKIGNDAAFTGDFLFVTSIGRPDIADRTGEWSAFLWKSLQSVRNVWPPDLVVYPAHYSSAGERAEGGAVCAKFGDLCSRNPSLRIGDESRFMNWIRQNEAVVPGSYRTIKGINVGLLSAGERESDDLESGRNEWALGGI